MGLLDDAIREHLELKRRHGADPSEVAKQEHEALGPVRRDDALEVPATPPAVDEAAHLVAEEEEERAYEESVLDVGDDPLEHAPLLDDPAAHPHETAVPPAPAPEPVAYEPPPAPEHEPAPEPPATHGSSLLDDPGQETVAFSAIEEVEAQEERPRATPQPPADVVPGDEGPADDELAETPDFLQETPEHDRLWFEQKPPRDFDF